MKIYSISVVLIPSKEMPVILSQASDLSSFPFYQRSSVAEFMSFFTTTVAARTEAGQRQSITQQNSVAHVYNKGGTPDQLVGTLSFRQIFLDY